MSSSEYTEEKFLDFTERIYKEKTLGNEFFKKGENGSAIEHYQNAIEIGDKLFKTIPDDEKKILKENLYFEKFKVELKNSYSNLSAVYLRQNKHKEIIEIDKFVISNLDEFFDKSYARLIIAYWTLEDSDNATNFYMMMLKKFNRETIQKYDEQLKPVAEKSKEIIEKMRQEYNQKQQPNNGKKGLWTKVIFFAVVLVLYMFGKGYLKSFFGGSPDIASKHNITQELNKENLNFKRTETDESIDLDSFIDEDLAIVGAESATSTDEGIDDKNSL